LVGILQYETGKTKLKLNIDAPITVSTLFTQLASRFKLKKRFLHNFDRDSLREVVLILVNGKDITVLDGLESKLKNEDVVTIIPFSHGG
jgi:molybdopterin converting factor small subunit